LRGDAARPPLRRYCTTRTSCPLAALGGRTSIVSEYRCLVALTNSDSSMRNVVGYRTIKIRRAVESLDSMFIRGRGIPIHIRTWVL
jgi:hypothetical protein